MRNLSSQYSGKLDFFVIKFMLKISDLHLTVTKRKVGEKNFLDCSFLCFLWKQ